MGVFGNINGVFSALGKPYIKLEFDDNAELLSFQKRINEGGEAAEAEFEDGEFKPVNGTAGDLGAPGDVYLVTDTRKNPRKELDETAAFKRLNVEKYTADSGDGWEQVKLIDIKTIYKDPARFQNRDTAESSESVNRIINDVEKGRFDWAKFDPIVVWRDPSDRKLYVLSGHSRTKAFQELSKAGATVGGKDFTKIPAKLFQGDETAAIDFALNSNTLSTKESDIERANYYRNKRKNGTPEAEIIEEIKNNEGKNWTSIWAFSHLLKDGFTNSALKALQNSSTENAELVKIVAEWIGKIFAQYPYLTPEHDKEIYKFLITEGAYGKGAGKINNYQTLREKVAKAIERRTEFGKFNSGARLNLWNLNESSNNMRVFDEKKANLSAELRAAINELNQKRKTFFQRAKADKSITNAQINKALQPYVDNVNLLQRRLIELESNKNKYAKADREQQALIFDGLGKNANNLLYNDNSIIDCRGFKPTYKILPSYDSFFDVAKNKNTFAGFGLDDTKKLIADTCRKHYKDCEKIAKHLKGDCLIQSAFNLWHWLRHNIRYEYDREGREEVRAPLRTWQDRERGVDCDCLSVFAWCVLKCMGYNPAFELAAFKNRENFTHIYINCDGIVVDRVWFIFNRRPPLVTKTEIYKVNLQDLGKLF